MPMYEYECEACGHRFEKIQKFSDKPLLKCPSCEKNTLHKLISAPAIQFKGSGWYVTDYAGKNADGTASSNRKSEKDQKTEKDRKVEKADKGEKSEKSEKAEKSEKPATKDAPAAPAAPAAPKAGGGETN
jgi:putative FmdB family regulatory protein